MVEPLQEFYDIRSTWRNPGEERIRMERASRIAAVPDSGRKVLDIGCRDGLLRSYLPPSVDYWGADIAKDFEADNIRIADLNEGIPYEDDSFDFAFAIEVLEHLTLPYNVFREVHRLLRDDGVFVFSVPNPYHVKEIIWNLFRIPDRQGHLSSWTRQTMTALAERAGFEVIEYGGTYLHPPIRASGLLARSILYKAKKIPTNAQGG